MNTLFETYTDALAVATSADQADDSQQAVACTDPDDEIAAELNAEASVDAYAFELSDLPQLYQDNAQTFYYSKGGVLYPSDREAAFVAYYRFVKTIMGCRDTAFKVSVAGEITVKHPALAALFDQAELINSYVPHRASDALFCVEMEHAYSVYRRLTERRIWVEGCDPELPPEAYSVNENAYSEYETARRAWQIQRVRAFNRIIRKVRASFEDSAYRIRLSKQQYEHKRLLQHYQDYVRDLMVSVKDTGRRRLLVVRLDLGMREATINKYDLTAFLGHLEALFRHTERQEVFKHLEGYIRKVEFGAEKGWHAHLILFFDYDHRISGYKTAEGIGDYWKQIVQQRCAEDCGVYFNCHIKHKQYKFNGIGMLDNRRKDYPDKLHNLLEYVVPYLLKNDYAVRFTDMPKQKLLTRGQLSQASQAALQSQSHMQQLRKPQAIGQQTAQKAAKPKLSPLERAEAMRGEKLSIRPHRSRRYIYKEFEKRR